MSQSRIKYEHLTNLLDAASLVSIISTDTNGIITVFNPGSERMLGYTSEEMIGKQTPAIIHLSDEISYRSLELSKQYNRPIVGFETFIIQALNHGYEEREWTYVRKDGEHIQVNLGVTPIKDEQGNLQGYLGIATNITERVKAEQRAIDEKVNADRANKAKSQFLSTMSHEIRTPLNGIIGIATHLNDTHLNKSQQKYVDTILHSGIVLQSILNNILDMGKIEAELIVLDLVVFDLRKLAENVIEAAKHSVDRDKVAIGVDFSELQHTNFIGDKLRISQILWNLVSNSIKFTHEGDILVSLKSIQQSKNGKCLIKISVFDTGIGISEEKFETIFEPFVQEDNSISRKYGGSGLGLSIVKKLSDLMNGKLDVKSKLGEGTTFSLNIELQISKEEPILLTSHDERAKKKEFERLDILVAEDNLINARVIKAYLEKLGCKHQLVSNGLEAVRIAKSHKFDLILMDIQMPEMDGILATKKIREGNFSESNYCQDTPIIALTAEAFKEQRQAFINAGINDVLTKPYTRAQLISIIEKYAFKI